MQTSVRLARDLALFTAGVLVAIGITSRALELHTELGQCRFKAEREGVFWQKDYPHDNYLTPRCGEIALAGAWNGGTSAWGWRLGLIATGSIETRDNVATYRDDEMGNTTATCQGGPEGHGCHAYHRGKGDLVGLKGSVTYAWRLAEHVQLIPEAGLLFYRSRYKNDARHVDCSNCAGGGIGGDAGGVQSGHWKDMAVAPATPFAGLTLRYRQVYVAIRRYAASGGRELSLTDHTFTQIATGIAWTLP